MGKLKRSKSNKDLRWGYTTGACAAASARAAVRMLISEKTFSQIDIQLPNRDFVTFQLVRLEQQIDQVIAGIIKDGGDDPDCTHGLEIQCTAKWSQRSGIHLRGGEGIATVTLPGLELPVGEPAINPIPKANILEMVQLECDQSKLSFPVNNDSSLSEPHLGLELIISAPGGEDAAKETISHRLGLIGGISILGTRGTVKPFSTSAYAASVRQSVQVAKSNGLGHVVLTTGSRSEKSAIQQCPKLTELAFIQAGDFIGVGLRAAKRFHVKRVTLVVMIGKLGKLISGRMMTHVSGHAIDFQHMSKLAREVNMSPALCEQISEANTGRHVLELVRENQPDLFLERLCQEAKKHADSYVSNALDIDVVLIDYDGEPLAHCCNEIQH